MPETPALDQVSQGIALAEDFKARLPQRVDDYETVRITSAELLALFATPKTLVPAPGAGFFLMFMGALMWYDFGSAAYAGIAAGEDLSIKYTGAAGLEVAQCEATGFLDQVTDQYRWVRPQTTASGPSQITPVANAPLVAHMLAGEITTGDGVLVVRTFYKKVPSALVF